MNQGGDRFALKPGGLHFGTRKAFVPFHANHDTKPTPPSVEMAEREKEVNMKEEKVRQGLKHPVLVF